MKWFRFGFCIKKKRTAPSEGNLFVRGTRRFRFTPFEAGIHSELAGLRHHTGPCHGGFYERKHTFSRKTSQPQGIVAERSRRKSQEVIGGPRKLYVLYEIILKL